MKKPLLNIMAVLMAVLILQVQAIAAPSSSLSANDEAIVNFDENEIYASFDDMNQLASYLENHDATYAEVQNYNSDLVANVSSSAALAFNSNASSDVPFISPFLWGCIFNLVGIAIVAITSDMDKDLIMKSVWGCVASSAFWVVFEIIYVVALGGAYWWL